MVVSKKAMCTEKICVDLFVAPQTSVALNKF